MKGNQFAYCYGESDKYAFWAITRTAKPALHSALERFKANKYIISKHELCKVGGCLLNGDEDTYGTLKNLLKDMSFFFDLVEIEIEGESFIIESAVRH